MIQLDRGNTWTKVQGEVGLLLRDSMDTNVISDAQRVESICGDSPATKAEGSPRLERNVPLIPNNVYVCPRKTFC